MQIAIIGWGSLIWCPGCLRIKSNWHSDGPLLPIEFARISNDQRLTLVIHPGSPDQRTYWALSEFETLKDARANLGDREGTQNLKNIHSLTTTGKQLGEIDGQIFTKIRQWLETQKNLEVAIWTGVQSNWESRRGKFRPEDAVKYVTELERAKHNPKEAFDRAREYIRNAPAQIQTPVRVRLRKMKGWKDATLPTILFAGTNTKSRS